MSATQQRAVGAEGGAPTELGRGPNCQKMEQVTSGVLWVVSFESYWLKFLVLWWWHPTPGSQEALIPNLTPAVGSCPGLGVLILGWIVPSE